MLRDVTQAVSRGTSRTCLICFELLRIAKQFEFKITGSPGEDSRRAEPQSVGAVDEAIRDAGGSIPYEGLPRFLTANDSFPLSPLGTLSDLLSKMLWVPKGL
jgi:hypothetical protein